MGIKGLNAVIADNAPAAIKALEIKSFFGRKVAIDASMSLYQFLIAVRQQDGQQLQNETGETTSHLMGMFYRTLRIVDNGIKPLYVFDGAPPKLKSGELAKRIARQTQANADAAEAKETGTAEDVDKFSRRTVRVTRQHNEEAKLLLKLMGIPYVEAPCEAEACCAQLAKAGKVYAAASEDMDTLCFDAPVLLRHLTFSEARKEPISEIQLSKALAGLQMNMDQFIDMCILLGCDYCDPIRGIGPKKAHDLILEHHNIEAILESLKGSKYEIPEDWPYKDARELFKNPDVNPWVRVGMSPLETELRERMKRNKEAAAEAAKEEANSHENETKAEEDKSSVDVDGTVKGQDAVPQLNESTDGTADHANTTTQEPTSSSLTSPTTKVEETSTSHADVTKTPAPDALRTNTSNPPTPSTQSNPPPDSPDSPDSPSHDPLPSTDTTDTKTTNAIDPYETPTAPLDLSASQSPDLPRLRVKISELAIDWTPPDVEGLVAFLCTDKGFSEDRVRSGAARLVKATKQKQQGRLDGFFKPTPGEGGGSGAAGGGDGGKKGKGGVKRKGEDVKKGAAGAAAKKSKTGASGTKGRGRGK